MKAAIRRRYGPPDVVKFGEAPKPTAADDEVLIEVHAVSLNASDWESLTGRPAYVRMWGLLKPTYEILGSDIAGRVEAVGKNVTRFKPGDEVFGDVLGRWGGLAEYACAPEKALMRKPATMTFEEASAFPQAALVALQGLRDAGHLQPGQTVLINGAGGGSGTFAVQLAKSFGAEVTGVDTARKFDAMCSLGANHVIDYTREDFTKTGERYDLILDFVVCRSIFANQRALSPNGTYVAVGGSVPRLLEVAVLGPLLSMGDKKMVVLAAEANKGMDTMTELFEAGTVTPVIDRVYPLCKAADALRYLGEGQARGKVVVTVRGATAGHGHGLGDRTGQGDSGPSTNPPHEENDRSLGYSRRFGWNLPPWALS